MDGTNSVFSLSKCANQFGKFIVILSESELHTAGVLMPKTISDNAGDIRGTVIELVHTADADKTKLSCLVRVGGVHTIRDKTKLSCLVTSCVHTADTDKTRRDSFVLSVSAV